MSHKYDAERKKMYDQGRTHRKFSTKPFWTEHKHYSDYMDGYHGRPFRQRLAKTPPLAKVFLRLAAWCGA